VSGSLGCCRASLVNQARIHNGYHYSHAYATAPMSRRNFETFADEYRHASNARLRMAFPMSLNIFLVFARLTYE
jgi:hypothetical protein